MRSAGGATLFAILFGIGCSTLEPVEPRSSELADQIGEEVRTSRVGSDEYPVTYFSGLSETTRLVVRDETTWKQVWGQIWAGFMPQPALPAVDFSQEMVVVAGMGTQPTGGYSIRITSAKRVSGGLEVTVRSESPGSSCGVTLALTSPVDIATVPRASGSVVFREKLAVRSC